MGIQLCFPHKQICIAKPGDVNNRDDAPRRFYPFPTLLVVARFGEIEQPSLEVHFLPLCLPDQLTSDSTGSAAHSFFG